MTVLGTLGPKEGDLLSFSDWIVTIEATGSGADQELVDHLVNTLSSATVAIEGGIAQVTFTVGADGAGMAVGFGLRHWRKVTSGTGLEVVRVETSAQMGAEHCDPRT